MNNNKKVVAVFFGAKSPEHDVSIITGLQSIKALDTNKYEALPIYIAPNGEWLHGEELLDLNNYMLSKDKLKKLSKVTLDFVKAPESNRARLLIKRPKRLFNICNKYIEFDIALLALHGLHGEDGQAAAIMEMANIPYTGMRHFASTILMNKIATKQILSSVGIPVLPHKFITRPVSGGFIVDVKILEEIVRHINFPLCVKPCNLGSSIGVAKANNIAELTTVLPNIFKYDQVAVLEPFIENLVEYNISVGSINNKIITSAIEKPKCHSELLDFKQKYMGGGNNQDRYSSKFGCKTPNINTGMLTMTREFNPDLDLVCEKKLRYWAELAFNTVYGSGFPRIDFLCNSKTKEIWLNEINPCPGSFGFYLWEVSNYKLLFTELLNALLLEAELLFNKQQLPIDPTPRDARLFPR